MTKRERELRHLLQHIADQAQAKLLQIRCTGSGHQRATLEKADGTVVNIIAPWSPSDYRSGRNLASFARRRLRA